MKTLISHKCPECGANPISITVTDEQYARFIAHDELIQNILPEVSVDDRERFMSGICTPCWDRIMSCDDED